MADPQAPVRALDLRGTGPQDMAWIRRWACRALDFSDETELADYALIATELLSNAYQHGHGASEIRLLPDRARAEVGIEVTDNSAVRLVLGRRPPPTASGGRGLFLVDSLSLRWGSRPNHDGTGKTVWAYLLWSSE